MDGTMEFFKQGGKNELTKCYMSFETGIGRMTESGVMVSLSYSFWKPLLSYFMPKCTHYLIHNGTPQNYNDGLLLVPKMVDEIINSPFDNEGKIKWFTLDLIKSNEVVLSIQHYGNEYLTEWIDEEEVEFIKDLLPEDFSTTIFKG